MDRPIDIRRIEVIDNETVAIMRKLGGTGRLRMLDRLSASGLELMRARVRELHPQLNEAEVCRHVRETLTRTDRCQFSSRISATLAVDSDDATRGPKRAKSSSRESGYRGALSDGHRM